MDSIPKLFGQRTRSWSEKYPQSERRRVESASTMYVFIARHGESLATVDPDWMGRLQPALIPLTVWGHEQALEMGRAIAELYSQDKHFQTRKVRIYSSSQRRLKQTSDAILQALPTSRVTGNHVDSLLRQREHGTFDGLSRESKQKTDPAVYAKLHSFDILVRYTTEMPGGESLQQVEERLRHFLGRLKSQVAEGEDVLIVTHGPQCRLLEAILSSSDPVLASQSGSFGAGDIVRIETDFVNPGFAQMVYSGKQRSEQVGREFKTEAISE